jgi:hypothetical protein
MPGTLWAVYAIAPRLDRRLIEAVVRLDNPSTSVAELHRSLREPAAQLGVPRPSYECVRLLVHDARRERERKRANRETLIRVALYRDGPEALHRLETGPHGRL